EQRYVAGNGKRAIPSAIADPAGCCDALLRYLDSRPTTVATDHVFLRSNAPCRPFTCGDGVSSVVKHALKRADIDAPAKGAHLLRHTADQSVGSDRRANLGGVESVGFRHHTQRFADSQNQVSENPISAFARNCSSGPRPLPDSSSGDASGWRPRLRFGGRATSYLLESS